MRAKKIMFTYYDHKFSFQTCRGTRSQMIETANKYRKYKAIVIHLINYLFKII